MINNFLWDFDKTLADTGNVSINATQTAFKIKNMDIPDRKTILSYMGIPAEISIPKMAHRSLSDEQIRDISTLFRNIYKRMERQNTILYPNILLTLSKLYANKKRLFIVSSKKTDALIRNLENLKISNLFEDIVGYDLVKHYKPAPDAILMVINKYHLSKSQSIMIGDAKYDVQMGHSANIKTCGAAWGAFDILSLKEEKPTYLFNQPTELLTLM